MTSRNKNTRRKPNRAQRRSQIARRSGNLGPRSSFSPTQIYRFEQLLVANISNINVSTGASTYNNPTASVCYFGHTSTNVTTDAMFAQFFTLADVPQYATFTALFDQYRIARIEWIVGCTQNTANQASASQSTTYPSQQLWYVVDEDDAGVVSPLTSLMEYARVKCVTGLNTLGKEYTVSFTPHVAVASYGGGAFTSYNNVASPWIDCGSTTVQHYGLKFGIPCPINTTFAQQNYTCRLKYYLEFKNVR